MESTLLEPTLVNLENTHMQIKGIKQRVIKLDNSKETRSADHLYAISAQ